MTGGSDRCAGPSSDSLRTYVFGVAARVTSAPFSLTRQTACPDDEVVEYLNPHDVPADCSRRVNPSITAATPADATSRIGGT
jgi:hypothetical protein